ncbi:hypothetical protein ACWGI8_11545 [Streptomyces sp. NPDC054841]
MDTRTGLALTVGGLITYVAYLNPILGAAIGVGVVVIALLLTLTK